ncbi:methyltransferase domain-containing protein [Chroococcidiopsidales cyanobacterium LEGE 13417]|nr:methyltransferase domain-containing protein [Chroococcidiopsidales cyanobacterium LEGE 13417]
MKTITIQNHWLESWKQSYSYDLIEMYGETSYRGYSYAYAHRYKHTLELVQKVARPGAKVLDVAAAQGNFSLTLAELGYEVTWNDLREELVDYVKLKWEYGTIHYKPGNVFTLGFDAEFDVILITEVIEHVAHPDLFLKKIAQMVKPGGHIVMSTPNGEYFQNRLPKFSDCPDPSEFEAIQFQPNSEGHIFLLHLDEIESIVHQAGLSIQETRIFTNPLTNGHIKLGKLLNFLTPSWVDTCEKFTQSLPLVLRKKIHTGVAVLLTRVA